MIMQSRSVNAQSRTLVHHHTCGHGRQTSSGSVKRILKRRFDRVAQAYDARYWDLEISRWDVYGKTKILISLSYADTTDKTQIAVLPIDMCSEVSTDKNYATSRKRWRDIQSQPSAPMHRPCNTSIVPTRGSHQLRVRWDHICEWGERQVFVPQ